MTPTRRAGLLGIAVAIIGGSVLAPTAALAISTTTAANHVAAPGWSTTWTAPSSYCATVRRQYQDEGLLVTPCVLYHDKNGSGGYFDWRHAKGPIIR